MTPNSERNTTHRIDDSLLALLGEYYVRASQSQVTGEEFGAYVDRLMRGRNEFGFLEPIMLDLGLSVVMLLVFEQESNRDEDRHEAATV